MPLERRMIALVTALVIFALLAMPLGAVAVVVAVTLVAARPHPWTAVVSAVLAAVLVVAWVLLSYRDGVRSDAPGAVGNVFSQVGWLVAAVVSGAAALTLQQAGLRRRSSRSS